MSDSMEFDIVIVGAGPAGLSCAIKLAQLNKTTNKNLSICVLEKGAEVGAHILSGAVLEPHSLNELLPDWQSKANFNFTPVTKDKFYWLSQKHAIRLPTPRPMHNHGNVIISLGSLCKYLAQTAENLGVDIFPGFPVSSLIYNENNQVIGVKTQSMGISSAGVEKNNYVPAMEIFCKQVVLAEGCHGSNTKKVIKKFNLRTENKPQTYALGVKEIWEIASDQHEKGLCIHSIGWPLEQKSYGGSFIYHAVNNLLYVGFVVGLNYQNPYTDPHAELQRFKHHPKFINYFKTGKLLQYGARALNEGGLQALPKLTFPGGIIIGCSAGFLNVAKIKGIHNAISSGIIAAKSIGIQTELTSSAELNIYTTNIQQSKIYKELYKVRNIRPAFKWGQYCGLIHAAVDTYIFRGKAPWTLQNHADHNSLKYADSVHPIAYQKVDGKISQDKLTSVSFSNTNHEEDQPCHLKLADEDIAISENWYKYGSPEQYYCPANVYEILKTEDGTSYLQINAQNCLHCKTCDIKDPTQNINWCTPEGGGGPNYSGM